jgi:hypothetical protein
MKKIIGFIKKNFRSIFYAFSIGLGLLFALQLLVDYGGEAFLTAVVVTSIVLCFEIYLDWRFATKVLRQIDMPTINTYNLWGHLLNHITLPLLSLFSFAGFIYFNSDELIRYIAIVLLVILNMILFINIRSYYRDEFKVEEGTRYIYDAIKLMIFFFGINLILHVKIFIDIDLWITAILVCSLTLILGGLLIYRRAQLSIATIAYVIIMSFIIAILFMVLSITGFLFIGINVLMFLLFYFSLSILHHKLERTLTLGVFFEYILILLLALILFFGIS